jgi:ribosome biogenesis GTPase
LEVLGWRAEDREAFLPHEAQERIPGRIAVEHRDLYVAYTEYGELWCELAGRLRHTTAGRGELPAVGDWAVLTPRAGEDRATINAVLPRRTSFSRKQAGFETEEQVLAANIDVVWILGALTRELSARRMEHYLAVAWNSGAKPVVVLTKADLGEADPERTAEVESIAVGAPVLVTSAVTGEGLDELLVQLDGNGTAAVLGSSGVGKSTLINRLIGEERLETHETRSDDVGRHTTTRRELVLLPTGGMVIDTPGLREIIPWEADTATVFDDIVALSQACRFRDCSHTTEPGCAIRRALASGELEIDRLRSYEKLQRELAYIERRKAGRARPGNERAKQIAKANRQRRKLGMDRKG